MTLFGGESTITWIKSRVSIPSGPYGIPVVEVIQYQSEDGRFTISPFGGMINKRAHGAHGMRSWRWTWKGFKLVDTGPTPAWGQHRGNRTLAGLKREAERRAREYPAGG